MLTKYGETQDLPNPVDPYNLIPQAALDGLHFEEYRNCDECDNTKWNIQPEDVSLVLVLQMIN